MVEYGADLHTMDHGSGFPTLTSKHLRLENYCYFFYYSSSSSVLDPEKNVEKTRIRIPDVL